MDEIERFYQKRLEALQRYVPLEGFFPGTQTTWKEIRVRLVQEEEEHLHKATRRLLPEPPRRYEEEEEMMLFVPYDQL